MMDRGASCASPAACQPSLPTSKASVEFQGRGWFSSNIQVGRTGANFIIGCHDGSVVNGSGQAMGADFYADIDNRRHGDRARSRDSKFNDDDEAAIQTL